MDKGFIRLSRTFFDNEIWQAARAYNESEAWLDLIQSARFEASETCSRIGCYDVVYNRGQYSASIRFLSKKWNRSEYWVRSFLARLKKRKMITTDDKQGITIITLVNFDKYNCQTDSNTVYHTPFHTGNDIDLNMLRDVITQLSTQQLAQLGISHTDRTNTKKGKNIKETSSKEDAKKDKEDSAAACAATIQEREKDFYNSLVPFVAEYGKEMVREFYDYWTEIGPRGKKMRFEKEGQFDLKKRLARWKKNESKYGSKETVRSDRRESQRRSEEETDNAIFNYAEQAFGIGTPDPAADIPRIDQGEIW